MSSVASRAALKKTMRLRSLRLFWLAIGLGLILVTPLGWLLGHVVMAITESEATGSGARHLQLRLLGLPFEMAGFVAFGVLRAGFHAVWTPILVMAVALIANSLYNAILVFGFGLGLTGLALGSSLAALTAVGCASFPIGRWGLAFSGWEASSSALRAEPHDPTQRAARW